MRNRFQFVVILMMLACAQADFSSSPEAGVDTTFGPEDLVDLKPPFKQWRMEHEYYGDLYATPAGPLKAFEGRWKVNSMGSTFQERSSGVLYGTPFVDAPLMEFISVGQDDYDWGGCLEVEIVGAVADYPSPAVGVKKWLIVKRVVSAEQVPGQQGFRDRCLNW
jgi:hypothetical protein